MTIAALTEAIVTEATVAHRRLGAGQLEIAYEMAMARALRKLHLKVERQVALPIFYKGRKLENAFRVDLLVERAVIVEIKSIAAMEELEKQIIANYIRQSGIDTGLLINFYEQDLRRGIIQVSHSDIER